MATYYEDLLMRVDLPADEVFAYLFSGHPGEYGCSLFRVSCRPAFTCSDFPAWVDASSHKFGFEYVSDAGRPLVRQLMLSLIARTNYRLSHGLRTRVFCGSYAVFGFTERTILNAEAGSNSLRITTAFSQHEILETFALEFEGMDIVRQETDAVIASRAP